jgi:hypothetical protein
METEIFLDKIKKVFVEAEEYETYIKRDREKLFHNLSKFNYHPAKKLFLGDRVQVLRVLVFHNYTIKMKELGYRTYIRRVEEYLDKLLIKFNYDLEGAIDWMHRKNHRKNHGNAVKTEEKPRPSGKTEEII